MIELKLTEQDAQVIQVALLELKIKDGYITFDNVRKQLEEYYNKSKETE